MKQLTLLVLLLLALPHQAVSQDEYNFDDLEDFEKKSFEWTGYVEANYKHLILNQDSVLYRLVNFKDDDPSRNSLQSTLQLSGSYSHSIAKLYWLLEAGGTQDETEWSDYADIYETYLTLQPSLKFTMTSGKKVLKWGSGYAWNPVGFVQRPKNPNDPELAREGFVLAAADYVHSYDGLLKTVSLTSLLLPVYTDCNDDFGTTDHLNLATRLYLLFLDTDIDFMFLVGESKTNRFGVDFSRNITTNLEIHGELAWYPDYEKQIVDTTGTLHTERYDRSEALLGLRYLTENDTTLIAELYHDGTGYSQDEMDDFYTYAESALERYEKTNSAKLVREALSISQKGYIAYTPMRNYFYLKVSNKEPFDILYFTPSLTALINLDDESFTITPECLYTGFDNFDIRFRATLYSGTERSEYGEKKSDYKFEIRLQYYF